MQHLQPLPSVQRLCQRAHGLEMAQGVQGDPGEPGPGGADISRLNRQHQELCLYHAVVAVFQLRPEHFRIKGPYPVEGVPLGGDLDPFPEIRPVHLPAYKGQLHADGGVMGVIHIAQGLKDRRLVVLARQLVIHILKLNAAAPGRIIQPAQPVRVHLPEGKGVLGRMGLSVALCRFNDLPYLPPFSGGEFPPRLYLGRLRLFPLEQSSELCEQSCAPPFPPGFAAPGRHRSYRSGTAAPSDGEKPSG